MSEIEVRAIHRGYFGGLIRERGDVFLAPAGMASAWWEPADGSAAPAAEAAPEPAPVKGKPGPKSKTVAAPVAVPFADAPEPVRVQNDVNDATGGTHPDWVAPVGGDI